ncbi:MAG: MarR family winged helix-turn-helix transcriptional regulator [bacterium]|nr:MarR family winged helix-turn-helix transcriptional regulator [bacterium]
MGKTVRNTGLFCDNIRQLSRILTRIYNNRIPKATVERMRISGDRSTSFRVEVSVRITQVAVLMALSDLSWTNEGATAQGVSQSELSDYLQVDPTTMCRNMQILVQENGWVCELPSASKRGKLLSISPRGLEVLRASLPAIEQVDEEIAALVGDGAVEIKNLVKAAMRVRELLKQEGASLN